jgi:hypothetical protein
MLEETFAEVHRFTLDPGTSLLETIAGISAAEASRPVYPGGATIAAQVNHVCFYIDGLLDLVRTGQPKELDWPSSWAVDGADDEQWITLTARLAQAYADVRELASTFTYWNEQTIGGAIALVSHSAYHLGEIRQGLGVLRA